MSILYFIRHGQASFGEKDYDQLSPRGILQARILGNHLAGIQMTFHEIYSGNMKRQQQTAEEVRAAFASTDVAVPALTVDPAFDEYDAFGIWEHHTRRMLEEKTLTPEDMRQAHADKRKFQNIFKRVMMEWIAGEHDFPGDERWCDFVERVQQGVMSLAKSSEPDKSIAVFSSGGPVSIIMKLALSLTDAKTMEISWQIMNASVTRFYVSSRGVFLSGFNDITHLALQRDANLLTFR